MNLIWDTRPLTQAREDRLTCFGAARLKADDAFRAVHEAKVLASLTIDGKTPTIATIATQATFAEQQSDRIWCFSWTTAAAQPANTRSTRPRHQERQLAGGHWPSSDAA